MAAHHNVSSEQMKAALEQIFEQSGTRITPGKAHLPTGQTIPVKDLRMHSEFRSFGGGGISGSVPLKNKDMRDQDANAHLDLSPLGTDLTPAHVGNYIEDSGRNWEAYKVERNSSEHVRRVMWDTERGREKTARKTQNDHWLADSTAHIALGENAAGPLKNPRYYSLYTGEFDDNILN